MTHNSVESKYIHCPYCGEQIEILIDCSVPHQNYIEDCHVCCRPIVLDVAVDGEGDPMVSVYHEDD